MSDFQEQLDYNLGKRRYPVNNWDVYYGSIENVIKTKHEEGIILPQAYIDWLHEMEPKNAAYSDESFMIWLRQEPKTS